MKIAINGATCCKSEEIWAIKAENLSKLSRKPELMYDSEKITETLKSLARSSMIFRSKGNIWMRKIVSVVVATDLRILDLFPCIAYEYLDLRISIGSQ
ncbi:MAG: hypothetical protein MK033_03055 [Candidatus Caenarcaniphilales bacterium]|nr:hypothetical protein [Candidatus Caenarcaniphilales bacterium]